MSEPPGAESEPARDADYVRLLEQIERADSPEALSWLRREVLRIYPDSELRRRALQLMILREAELRRTP